MNTYIRRGLASASLLALSYVAHAVTSDPAAVVDNPAPTVPTAEAAISPAAPPLADLQATLTAPMGQPKVYGQAQVPRPNLGGDESRAPQNRRTLDQVMKMLGGAKGAPKARVNGRPNPRFEREFDDFAGGPRESFPAKDMSGELSPYNITNDPKTASDLVGHDCNKNTGNRLVCMVCNIMFEAATEPKDGQLAVGQNVMTRVYSRNYPDTVCKNVYKVDRGVAQYSWVLENKDHRLKDGERLREVFQSAVEALQKGPNGYTNYYAPSGMIPKNRVPDWAQGGNCAATLKPIGSQLFCTINAHPMRSTTEVAQAEGLTLRSAGYGGGVGGGSAISR